MSDGITGVAGQSAPPVAVDGLFETHIAVRDLQQSIAFYRDTLGLTMFDQNAERRFAFFWLGPPGRAFLGVWEGSNILRMQLHFALACSVEAVLAAPARLRAVGVTPRGFHGEESDTPVVFGNFPAVAVYCRDPDDHSVEFLAMLDAPPRPELGLVSWPIWRAAQGSSAVTG
jgi:lactoylglutathione lyase